MQINKYKNLGSGWKGESQRHSNAVKYGVAGGLYADKKKYYKILILNDSNEWVSTDTNMSLKEAFNQYKKDKERGEFSYNKDNDYYVFGVEKEDDEFYP